MIAEIAGKLIAKFVEKQWPSDKEDVYEILRLAVNKAWQDGKWLGMTQELYVPVHKDRVEQSYIIAPYTHSILLALNGQHNSMRIRDEYFMFHRNGYGDIRDYPGCSWNTDVYDIGEVPYYDRNNINFADGVRIGVRALGPAGTNEKVYINGTFADGNEVFTYKKTAYGDCCGCEAKTDSIDTINGIEINVTSGFNYISNITFTSISSITKTLTRTPIEVIAIDNTNSAYSIARLLPNQRFSKYRKYLIPNDLCGRTCLHGLFKISQQDVITQPTDSIMISNEEALISLAKGVYNMYYKEQQEIGASFVLQGLSVLEKEKREEESPSEYPIQVDGIYDGDLTPSLKHYS
jgi:hypothetical protein